MGFLEQSSFLTKYSYVTDSANQKKIIKALKERNIIPHYFSEDKTICDLTGESTIDLVHRKILKEGLTINFVDMKSFQQVQHYMTIQEIDEILGRE